MTKRQRFLLATLTEHIIDEFHGEKTPQFTDWEIRDFVCNVLSAEVHRKIQFGKHGEAFKKNVNAALSRLAEEAAKSKQFPVRPSEAKAAKK